MRCECSHISAGRPVEGAKHVKLNVPLVAGWKAPPPGSKLRGHDETGLVQNTGGGSKRRNNRQNIQGRRGVIDGAGPRPYMCRRRPTDSKRIRSLANVRNHGVCFCVIPSEVEGPPDGLFPNRRGRGESFSTRVRGPKFQILSSLLVGLGVHAFS